MKQGHLCLQILTLKAVCNSSFKELISCFKYWISDSLTRSRTCNRESGGEDIHKQVHNLKTTVLIQTGVFLC